MSFIVAIDGPAGTGKGTIASLISEKFGFLNVDTGAMFRCVTLEIIRRKIELHEIEKIEELLSQIEISFKEESDGQHVFLNGEDVSTEIRTKQITDIISEVSKIPQVRGKLLELQRNLAVRTKYCYGRKRHRNCSISKCRCKNLFRCISRRKNKKKNKTK